MPEGYIVLEFTSTSTGAEGHRIYRSTSPMNPNALPASLASLPKSANQYIDYDFADESAAAENLYYRVSDYWRNQRRISEEMSIPNPGNVLYPDSPTWLFGDAEDGFANVLGIDTLYTDTAGTTPVSAYGDTIALAGNLAPNGPDMVQATTAARPVYGRMPMTRVKNLLAQGAMFNSETFSGFTLNRVTFGTSDGSLMRLTEDDTDGNHFVNPSTFMRVTSGVTYTAFVIAKPGNVPWFQLAGTNSGFVDNQNFGNFNVATGTVGNKGSASTTFMTLCPPELVADYPEFSGAYICALQLTADESTNAGFQIYLTNNQNFLTRAPSYLGTNGNNILLTRMMVAEGARDADWFVANYQKVVSAYDVTEEGVPSVDIAYLDGADDAFPWTLDAGTYYMFLAGEKGYHFDTIVHAGGAFTVGPTTWTGGPPDALADLIGNRHVILPELRDEPFTEFEQQQLVAYAAAKGCPV